MGRFNIFRAGLGVLTLILAGCGGGGGGASASASNNPPAAQNQPPTAEAGADQVVDEQSQVMLPGSGSDSDGSVAGFAWVQISGSPVTLSSVSVADPTFSAPSISVAETLTFSLTVTDDSGGTATDTVDIDINPVSGMNDAPVANAGLDRTVFELSNVSLNANMSNDPDGSINSYDWIQAGGPSVTVNNSNNPVADFDAPDVAAPSNLTFQLTITDNESAIAVDTVVITVIEPVAMIDISGRITYDSVPHRTTGIGLDYANTTAQAVRGAVVEAIDGSNGITVLASTSSDANGNYQLSVLPNTDVKIRARAQMRAAGIPSWDFKVIDNTNNGALYVLDSQVFNSGNSNVSRDLHAASGWGGAGYTSTRAAGPFSILDAMYQAYTLVLSVDPSALFAPLSVNWSVNNVPTGPFNAASGQIITSFFDGTDIYLLGAANVDTDEYDQHVIAHEWGHYFENVFSRSDSVGGAHGSGDRLDMRVAFGEGWGNAFSGMARGNPLYADSLGSQQNSGFTIDVEANHATVRGWFSESSVQSILYDIFDTNNDSNDVISLGFAPLSVNWSVNNVPTGPFNAASGQIITSFFDGTDIYLLGAANVDTDEYDQHVIAHEWGHYFENVFSRSDSVGGAHGSGDRLDMRVAFGEGWGNAFSGMARGNPLYADSLGSQQGSGFTIDVEANHATVRGWFSESSVQSILYDIFDANNDSNDVITLGFAPLYDVFAGGYATDVPLTSIFSFVTDLKTRNPGSAALIDTLLSSQIITAAKMDAWGSTEINNAGNPLDVLPVYSDLVVDGGSANVCSISSFQTFNGTSVRRFLRFDVSKTFTYTISATGPAGSDPDIVLHQAGVLMISQSLTPADETFDFMLTPGTYVLEVYEFSNLTDTPSGRTCMDVSVAQSNNNQSIP